MLIFNHHHIIRLCLWMNMKTPSNTITWGHHHTTWEWRIMHRSLMVSAHNFSLLLLIEFLLLKFELFIQMHFLLLCLKSLSWRTSVALMHKFIRFLRDIIYFWRITKVTLRRTHILILRTFWTLIDVSLNLLSEVINLSIALYIKNLLLLLLLLQLISRLELFCWCNRCTLLLLMTIINNLSRIRSTFDILLSRNHWSLVLCLCIFLTIFLLLLLMLLFIDNLFSSVCSNLSFLHITNSIDVRKALRFLNRKDIIIFYCFLTWFTQLFLFATITNWHFLLFYYQFWGIW